MSFGGPLLLGFALWALASFAYRALGLRAVSRLAAEAAGPTPAPGGAAPRAALLRPLLGSHGFVAECLESLWRAAEIGRTPVLVAIESTTDPAHKEVARVRERYPAVPVVVRSGAAPRGENRKIANLIQLDADASAEVLILSDADIRVAPDYVERVLAPFCDAAIGLSTAPYRSVPQDSTASRCDALLTNLHFLPNTCFAVRFEGLHFGLGSTLAIRRSALNEIGGLEAIVDEPGDDSALAHRVAAAGWELAWLPMIVDHRLADVGWRAALARHLRCARITRGLRPFGYVGLLAVTHGWIGALVAGALWGLAGGPGWLLPLAWWGSLMGLQWRGRRALALARRDVALAPVVDVLGLCVMIGAHWGRPTPP